MRTGALLVFLSLPLALIAQDTPSKQAQVDRILLQPSIPTPPGCAVGVADHGATVLTAGYGMADLERDVPITADTVFESGSVAMQFTAAALHLLARQGKLSLDDPLRKYLPELPEYEAPLTIRHVLSHVSGLREWRPLATFSGIPEGRYSLTNDDLLRLAAKQRSLNFTPGSAWSYSNTGFNVLTIVVERVLNNGQTFADFTREAIFKPLNMTHSRLARRFPGPWFHDAHWLTAGTPDGGWKQETPIENIIGAGGMLTTVADWLLWNENFTHARVGGPEFIAALQTPGRPEQRQTGDLRRRPHAEHGRRRPRGIPQRRYRRISYLARPFPRSGHLGPPSCAIRRRPTAVSLGHDVARLWTGAKQAPKPTPAPVDPARLDELSGLYVKVRGQYRRRTPGEGRPVANGGHRPDSHRLLELSLRRR